MSHPVGIILDRERKKKTFHSGIQTLATKVSGLYCIVYWKLYCKQVPFDPLKCMAGVNVQCKKDWCVEI